MKKSVIFVAGLAILGCIHLPAQQQNIAPTFFGISLAQVDKYPTIPFGAVGHPPAMGWSFIEPSKGHFNWGSIEPYVEQARKNGLDSIITFEGTPLWAAADVGSCKVKYGMTSCTSPPANIQDWKDFITAVVQHFNGVTAPHISFYEIWNEANTSNSFTGTYADLVRLAQAAYPIIHTDPLAQVLTPSVVGSTGGPLPENAPLWMEAYLQRGGSKYADIGSFHGYVFRSDQPIAMPEATQPANCVPNPVTLCHGSILTLVSSLRSVFDANGLAGKPMFDTEGSWGRATLTDHDAQLEWLSRWYLLQASAGVSRVYWYMWASSSVDDWGPLVEPGGKLSIAALAYGHLYTWLSGAKITPCTVASDHSTWTCGITRENDYQGQILWNTAGFRPRTVASAMKQFRDLSGNIGVVPANGVVTIGPKPVLVETNNP